MHVNPDAFEALVGGGSEHDFLRAILEHIEDGIVACDADGVLRYFNRATRAMHGLPEEPVPADQWAEHYGLYHTDGKTPLAQEDVPLYRALRDGAVTDAKMVIVPTGQRPRHIVASGRAIFGPDGAKLGAVVSMHEVTDRIDATTERELRLREQDARARAESLAEALRESEARFRNVADHSPMMMWVTRPDGYCTYLNKAWYHFTGQTEAAGQGFGWLDAVHPQDTARAGDDFRAANARREPFRAEYRLRRRDGVYRWCIDAAAPRFGPGGEYLGYVGSVIDIDERKEAEDSLREAEAKFRLMANSISQLAWMARPDGHIFWYNSRWYEYTGTSPENQEGWGWESVHDPRELPKVVERWKQSLDTGKPFDMTFPLRGAAGDFRPFLTRVNPLRDAEGNITLWFGTNTDVSERAKLEERFRITADSAAVLIWIADTTKACIWFNKPWIDFTGRTQEQEYGSGWAEGVHPDDFARRLQVYTSNFDARTPYKMEYRLRRHDGEWRWILDNGTPLFEGTGGAFSGYVGSCIDITEMKATSAEREALLDRERAARAEAENAGRLKDEFLATLSHELRTPLNAILGWAQLLRRPDREEADVGEGLAVIERNARAQVQLIEDLLDMSRIVSGKLRLDVQRIDLAAVIRSAVESVAPAAEAKGIRIQSVLDTDLAPIRGDPGRLQQVVWNLLANAIKFTPKGGRVQVALERVNSHVEITVTDTGAGIPPDFLPHVFERFRQADAATTRRYAGLGLGLSIVKSIVEAHGGKVRAKSPGEGRGASFSVELPLMAIHDDPADPAREHPRSPPGDGPEIVCEERMLEGVTVLVVDDERDAREIVRRLLEECYAKVIVAPDADEAFRLFRTQRPDVLLSDIGMPGEDGYSLIQKVRRLAPADGGDTPAAALTAFARSEDRRRALMAGFQSHVSKPVESAELVTVVASLAGKMRRGKV